MGFGKKDIVKKKQNPEEIKPEIRQSSEFEKKEIIDTNQIAALIDKAKELVKDSNACGMMLETEKSNKIGNNLYPETGFKKNDLSNFYEWVPD